jgi:hypothetical protein
MTPTSMPSGVDPMVGTGFRKKDHARMDAREG